MATTITTRPAMTLLKRIFEDCPWDDQNFYSAWLKQSYFYTRYSTRLLAVAAGLTHSSETNYFRRSVKHISEEQGHEQIALNDLRNLNVDSEEIFENSIARSMWETQFFKIQKDPSTLLGYVLALEELAVLTFPFLYERLNKTFGVKSTIFVKVHAEDDPDHVEEALTQVREKTVEQQAKIFENYDQTCDLYRYMLLEIRQSLPQNYNDTEVLV